MGQTQFTWRGIPFVVRCSPEGQWQYRHADNWGGPWSNAERAVANPDREPTFRRALGQACGLI